MFIWFGLVWFSLWLGFLLLFKIRITLFGESHVWVRICGLSRNASEWAGCPYIFGVGCLQFLENSLQQCSHFWFRLSSCHTFGLCIVCPESARLLLRWPLGI